MTKKQDKRKENIINHIDCINQMDKLHEKLKSYEERLVEKDSRIKELEEMFEASQNTNKGLFDRNIELNEQIQKLEDKVSNLEMKYKEIEIEKDKYKIKTKNFVNKLKELDIIEEDRFIDFIEKFKNNINGNKINEPIDIINSNEYINLQKDNIEMKAQIDDLNIKLYSFSSNKNIDDKINDFSIEDKINQAISIFKEEQDLKHKEEIKFYKNNIQELEEKMNARNSIPTPSSSTEKEEKTNNKDIDEKLICSKCNKENVFLYSVGIYKGFCRNCKNIDLLELLKKDTIFFDKLDESQKGYRTINNFTETLYYKLLYNNNIYLDAEKDGIDTTNWNILINYIKKYKQIDTSKIKNKLMRSRSLILLFNDNKFKDIQYIIKGINFSSKILYNLNENQWLDYRTFIENILNSKLEKLNNKNNINSKDLIYPCINDICEETVNIEGFYCNICNKDLKPCKHCKNQFWTDDSDIVNCDDCTDSDDE